MNPLKFGRESPAFDPQRVPREMPAVAKRHTPAPARTSRIVKLCLGCREPKRSCRCLPTSDRWKRR